MPAAATGTKTLTNSLAPHLSAATLTALLATPIENLTVAQFKTIEDALGRVKGGGEPTATIASLLL